MKRIMILLNKEWLELRQERTLVLTTIFVPALLTFLPLVTMFFIRDVSDDDILEFTAFIQSSGLSEYSVPELGQILIGQAFGMIFLIIPIMLPSTIAAYSIVGEKIRRTLEPLLATPITVIELLVGKTLAALLPTVLITWFWGIVYIVGMRLLTTSPDVFAHIITPGWLILWLLCAPMLALIAVVFTVLISSRASDPRSAQQNASILILPLMLLIAGQLFGLQVLSANFALIATAVAALIAGGAMWLAVRVFHRDTILKRWA